MNFYRVILLFATVSLAIAAVSCNEDQNDDVNAAAVASDNVHSYVISADKDQLNNALAEDDIEALTIIKKGSTKKGGAKKGGSKKGGSKKEGSKKGSFKKGGSKKKF